jgi:exosortase A
MHADPQIAQADAPAAGTQPLVAFAVVTACVLGVLALFWPTTLSMVEIWRRSETFQHCFLVVPIVLWLVWNERMRLAGTPVRPFWAGVVLIAAAGALWAFGVLASAQVISHLAVIAMIPAVVVTIFGLGWARVLWFPLLFLFFAVPFGEALVPKLMDWTADFTVTAVKLSGVPVYREGTHFVIPSGQWSVIEACSGIKFLIASLMGGSLYAWLMYRSPGRRLAFIGASILVPLIANWLRAYIIVMVGHLSNNRLMTGDDHLIFGWVLFAAIMLATYWFGARWREDDPVRAQPAPAALPVWGRSQSVAAAIALLALVAFPPLTNALMRPVGLAGEVTLVAPSRQGGWTVRPGSLTAWAPELDGAAATRSWVFERDSQRVELFLAAFRHQSQYAQLGSSTNQLVRSRNERWKQIARDMVPVPVQSKALPGTVRSGEVRPARGSDHLLVWHWFYSGGRATTSEADAKLDVAWARLRRQPDTALWVSLATPLGTDRAAAQRTLEEFARDMGPSLAAAFRESTLR